MFFRAVLEPNINNSAKAVDVVRYLRGRDLIEAVTLIQGEPGLQSNKNNLISMIKRLEPITKDEYLTVLKERRNSLETIW